MHLEPHQRRVYHDRSQFRLIVKSRQVGLTFLAAYEACRRIIPRGGECVLISQREKASVEWIRYIRRMLPKVEWSPDNVLELGHPNGARCTALPNRPESARYIRGDLYIDEAAHLTRADEILDAALPLVTREGYRLTFMSSPNGKTGEFYKLYQGAVDGTGMELSVHEIPVLRDTSIVDLTRDLRDQPRLETISPHITIETLEQMRRRGRLYFEQEYLCSFLASANAYFDIDSIDRAIQEYELIA